MNSALGAIRDIALGLCLGLLLAGHQLPAPAPAPPAPAPIPAPTPTPAATAPIPLPGLRVLIVFDFSKLPTYPPGQATALNSTALREYLDAKTTGREWRMWDDSVNPAHEAPHWQAVMRRPRGKLPWIVVSNGVDGYEGPLPADADATIELIKRYEAR